MKQFSKSSSGGFGGSLLAGLASALSGGLYAVPDVGRGIQAYQLSRARKAYEQSVANDYAIKQANQDFEKEKFDYTRGQDSKKGQGNAKIAQRWGIVPQALPSMDGTQEEFFSDFINPGNISEAQKQFYGIMNSDATGDEISNLQKKPTLGGAPQGTMQQPGAMQAGARYNELANPAELLLSQGAVDWTDVNTRLKNNQDNENTDFSNLTTRSHYERADKNEANRVPAQNAKDYASASLDNRTNPNLRSGGGAQPSEATRAYQAWQSGLLSDDEYRAVLGANRGSSSTKLVDPELQTLQEQYKYAPDTNTKKAIGQKIQDRINAMDLGTKYGSELLQNLDINGALGGPTFGNQSIVKMKKASQGLYGLNY